MRNLFLSRIDDGGLAKRASRMDDTGLADTHLHDDLNTGPGTRGHGATISAARAHTNSHRRLNHSPRNESKNLRSPTSLTRRRRKTKELFPKGYKNDADRRACHAAPNSWKTA